MALGTCWATGSWAADAWAEGSWYDAVARDYRWLAGACYLLEIGGGIYYARQLSDDSTGNTFTDINRIEPETDTDLTIACSANYTLVLEKPVWDDLRIAPSTFDFAGSGDPALVDYQPGGSGTTFKVYEFDLGDQAFFTVQLPHSYKQGQSIYCHVHWTPGTRGNEENGAGVAWKLDYSWANIGGTFGASSTIDLTDTCTGTDHYHEMSADVEMAGTSKNMSSMLLCRIYRADVAGDTWAGTNTGNLPILLEVDFHFPIDTIGSRQRSAK